MIEDRKILSKLNEFIEKNMPVAMITIISIDGSTPRGVGSTMLIDINGNLLEGTIGGGILEEKAKEDGIKYIKENKSGIIEYNLASSKKGKNNLPMTCGGNVSIFVKVYYSQENLIIAGAGHVAEKISKIANIMGYSITILDDRKERLTSKFFPNVDNLILGNIVENIEKINIDSNSLIIIVTHGHKYDQDVLEAVLRSDAKYIGMIGSSNKIRTNFKNLMEKGFTKEELSKVYTPIGIDIGGETPEEVALSIMAEIQAVKYNKLAPHLLQSTIRF